MKRILIGSALAISLVIGCESMKKKTDDHDGGATEATIAMSDVPAAVSAAFAKDHPGVTASRVKKETYADGLVHYEFEWTDAAGKKHDVEYSADGEQLDEH